MTRSEVLKYALEKLIELGYHDIDRIRIEMLSYFKHKIEVELTVYLYRGRFRNINLTIPLCEYVGDYLTIKDIEPF